MPALEIPGLALVAALARCAGVATLRKPQVDGNWVEPVLARIERVAVIAAPARTASRAT